MAENVKMYSAKQVASRINTDAKQLRKFFRDANSGYDAVGQGGRYDFPESEIPKIEVAFKAWSATKTRRNRPSASQPRVSLPGQRTQSPVAQPRKDPKQGLHGNALDEDDIHERFKGIAARMEKHGLTMKQGRFVPQSPTQSSTSEGLTDAQPQILDFTETPDRGPTDQEILQMMSEIEEEDE